MIHPTSCRDMILTLFSFGFSWVLYTFVFFGLTRILPGFHSPFFQSTFTIGFLIGFINALIIKSARVMALAVPFGLLYVLIFVIDVGLIFGTNNMQIGYYITGHKGPVIAAAVLAFVAFATEFIKDKFRADVI